MDVIALQALSDGVPAEAEVTIDGGPQSILLLREGTQVRAWRNICPHAGRRLDMTPGKFLLTKAGHLVCAVHGATFELQGGQCLSGPCRGEALQAVAVQVSDGWVTLASSRSIP